MQNNPLDEVPANTVIWILLISIFVLPFGGYALLGMLDPDSGFTAGERFTFENLMLLTIYPAMAVLLWVFTRPQHRPELAEITFNIPEPTEIRSYIRLALGMVIASIGFTYLFFYPLSLLSPDLVQSWLLDMPYFLYWDDNGIYLLGNLAAIVSAVIFAPVIEEYVFRGYLLNRWTLRLSSGHAVILSSTAFAVLHTDVLGAMVFGVMMSLLYMKTRTLWAPIIVHAINNLIAISLEWLDRSMLSGFEPVTVADFQSELLLGVVCMIIGFPWLWYYVQRHFMPVTALLTSHKRGGPDEYVA